MKRTPVRRVRWRKRESGRFAVLALVEAVNPAALSERDRNELERLDRRRRARWHAKRGQQEKRWLRRVNKGGARLRAVLDNLALTFTPHKFSVPTT